MLLMLIPDDAAPESEERFVVLTVQPRVPAGSLRFVELPAGMVDGAGDFRGVAAREIEEELGISLQAADLTCLNELAAESATSQSSQHEGKGAGDGENLPSTVFPSPGGCDEHVTIYSYEKRVPRGELASWTGRLTGQRAEGEKITLRLVPMKDLWKEGARDAKCLSALALWHGLRQEARL